MITSRLAPLLLCAAIGAGCGVVADLAESQKKSEEFAVALEKELGVKPFVGWNINNGTLTNVNVNFPLEGVARLAAGELHAKVRTVVSRHFGKAPEQLIVSTFSTK